MTIKILYGLDVERPHSSQGVGKNGKRERDLGILHFSSQFREDNR